MPKTFKTVVKALPSLITLFRGKTTRKGKEIVKSGIASLTISGLISTGRISGEGIDGTLLLILSILETIGYLYGMIALSSGAAQVSELDQLLDGKGEGLREKQAKQLGQQWLKQMQKNQPHRISGSSLFDDDHSDLKVKAMDILPYKTNKNKKKTQ